MPSSPLWHAPTENAVLFACLPFVINAEIDTTTGYAFLSCPVGDVSVREGLQSNVDCVFYPSENQSGDCILTVSTYIDHYSFVHVSLVPLSTVLGQFIAPSLRRGRIFTSIPNSDIGSHRHHHCHRHGNKLSRGGTRIPTLVMFDISVR